MIEFTDKYECIEKHIGLTFLGPSDTSFARCLFRAQKSLDFQGPPLPMALEIEFSRIKIITFAPY